MHLPIVDCRRQRAELVELFASELSRYVGRGSKRVRRDGLRAGDFDGDVLVDFADGSTMTFAHALVVQKRSKQIGVFTEHCGYYAFEPRDIRVSRIWDGHVFRQYGDLSEPAQPWPGTLEVDGRRYVAVPFAAYHGFRGGERREDAIVYARLAVARDLRGARKQAGLTRRALAKLLGKSVKTVCKTELGRTRVTTAYVRKLLAACGLPLDWRAPART